MNSQYVPTGRFLGRVGSVLPQGYGFIILATVQREDGSSHGLETHKDVFVHQNDCSSTLRPGMHLVFDVVEKEDSTYQAAGASEYVEPELVPAGELMVPGFNAAVEFNAEVDRAFVAHRVAAHQKMKPVPPETVEQVIANEPLPTVPREFGRPNAEQQRQLLSALLAHLFPSLHHLDTDFDLLGSNDEDLDRAAAEAAADLSALGIGAQTNKVNEDIRKFRTVRQTLRFIFDEGLVRPDTIIPTKYLPDLFMAVPVWFFWGDDEFQEEVGQIRQKPDPGVHDTLRFVCGLLFNNQRWADTFLMFNRRIRSMREYGGEGFDIMPSFVARRLRKAVAEFDVVAIATPYCNLAGKDWTDLDWIRSLDPYVFGFKKELPDLFFSLARFSDSGTFPLFHELVADNINFLKANKQKLLNFDAVSQPFWYPVSTWNLGTKLLAHAGELLQQFEEGNLFSWLREEDVVKTAAS